VASDSPPGVDAEQKTLAASERDEEARAAWRAAAAQLDPQQLVFIDESGTTISLTRLSGWAPHHRRASGSVPRTHGKTTTLVAALAPDGLHEPWLIEGAMDTDAFTWYITEQLAPTLRPGQIVVLDNLSAHQADRIRQAIEARHCHLLFLPPYSPDFTPIEQAFSKIKAIQSHPARAGCAHQGGASRSGWPRHRGHYPTRCRGLVRPRRVRSACSGYLKVALERR
jgi:transposase